MKLTLTDSALQKINELNHDNNKYILLRYDTKGLGCGVNGMPTFSLVSHKENNYLEVENNSFPTIIDRMQAVFFAEEMKLDFVGSTFRLSSPDGILNPLISISSFLD